jgi:hypothetical protein
MTGWRMIAIKGYYENDRVQLLEPVPEAARAKGRHMVAVLFLGESDEQLDALEAVLQQDTRSGVAEWGEPGSEGQERLAMRAREELAPYAAKALRRAVGDEEEDWEELLA